MGGSLSLRLSIRHPWQVRDRYHLAQPDGSCSYLLARWVLDMCSGGSWESLPKEHSPIQISSRCQARDLLDGQGLRRRDCHDSERRSPYWNLGTLKRQTGYRFAAAIAA